MAGRITFNRAGILSALYAAEEEALEQVAADLVARARSKAPVRKIYKENNQRRKSRSASPELIAAAIRTVQNNKRLTARQRTEALYLLQRHPEEARVAIRRHNSNNRSQRSRPLLLGKYKSVSLKKNGLVIATEDVFRGRGTARGTVPLRRIERNVRPKLGYEPGQALDENLSARGRYEIRSGRALTNAEGDLIESGSHPTQVRVGGRLKKSIESSAITREGTRVTIQVGTDVPYALYVEFPTRHNAAQPFLLPALHEVKRQLGPTLANELRAHGLKRG